jgi:hypothetical protein
MCHPRRFAPPGRTTDIIGEAKSGNHSQPIPKESLTLTFGLVSGVDFGEVIAALKTHDPVHGVVVGVQMTGFTSAGRESYVVAPEPASLTMLGMSSLAGLVYAWRRRKRAVT